MKILLKKIQKTKIKTKKKITMILFSVACAVSTLVSVKATNENKASVSGIMRY